MAETKSEDRNGLDSTENRSQDFKALLEYGLDSKVAGRLDEIYKTGKLSHADLDDRALDALKEFPTDGALSVLAQFLESNLEHVSNKSAFLCGVMKTYRQRSRAGSGNVAASQVNGSNGSNSSNLNGSLTGNKGPDEDKIKEILERTGYTLDVTTGQRKFGGPPPGWEGEAPSKGCEVFCGKIPRDMYENDLIPLFEKCGKIWDLRLMMDPMTGLNRGYAFITFTTRHDALEAVRQLDSYEIGEGKTLKVNVSEPKTRLFIGNIPKSKGRDEIDEEFKKLAAGLREVIIYSSPDDRKKNRGFCFLEYESHKAASLAKRRLETGRIKVWSCDIIVDWADPQEEPDDDTMSQVKVLYVRNLTATVTEEKLREVFEVYGKIERVKKIKDYAFVHFEDRHHAVLALKALHRQNVCGSDLDISLAKPPSDKKKKEDMLRKREQRMMKAMANSMAMPAFPPFANPFGPMAVSSGLFRAPGPGARHIGGPNQTGLNGSSGSSNRSLPRGYDGSGNWGWNGNFGDGSWAAQTRLNPMSGHWAGENWNGARTSYGWNPQNGSTASGVYSNTSGQSSGPHQGGGRGTRKTYNSSR